MSAKTLSQRMYVFLMAVASVLLMTTLGGCAQVVARHEVGTVVAERKPLSVADAALLLHYAQASRAMNGKEQADELERLRQAYVSEKTDTVALQYALILSVPGATVANQRRALQVLETFLMPAEGEAGAGGRKAEVQALASLLRSDLVERRRLEDIAYSQTLKLREEQRRSEELEKQVEAQTKKLEALVNIERRLLRRGKKSLEGEQ